MWALREIDSSVEGHEQYMYQYMFTTKYLDSRDAITSKIAQLM